MGEHTTKNIAHITRQFKGGWAGSQKSENMIAQTGVIFVFGFQTLKTPNLKKKLSLYFGGGSMEKRFIPGVRSFATALSFAVTVQALPAGRRRA